MEDCKVLVERARAKDRDAFARLYEMVYADMYRFALYTLKNCHDAEDVVADAVADAYNGISSLREADAFKNWIFKILSNKCRRRLKEYTRKTSELPDDLEKSGDFTEEFQVRQAFARLSDEERLIISMHLFVGYTSREISRILHKNENTIRSKESRALAKMRQMLEE